MIAVLDGSAAVEVVLARPAAEEIAGPLSAAELVLAPGLYVAEISNVLWKHARAAGQPASYSDLLDDAVSLPDDLVGSASLCREDFALSTAHEHPIYDALYLVVARRNNAGILTVDRRLRSLAERLDVRVIRG